LLNLSTREREVLQLLIEGKSTTEIADILIITKTTVSTYRQRIMQKLDIHDLPTLVKFAIQHNLTSLAEGSS
jgi:DNA-binding NarL/FixJ family response regulator